MNIVERTMVDNSVSGAPMEAAVLFERMWLNAGRGASYVDACDCAQAIIPTDLQQLARYSLDQFGLWQCADRIFMLNTRCYTDGGKLRVAEERKLFGDYGLVRYFLNQHAEQFGYRIDDPHGSGDEWATPGVFRIVRQHVVPAEQHQLALLGSLQRDLEHNLGFYAGTEELTQLLRKYMSERHDIVMAETAPRLN